MMTKSPSARPETTIDRHTTRLPRYKVLLHNDDVNSMERVVRALMTVFKFGRIAAERIMMEAHRNGLALCAVEPLEQAELHRDQLTSFSLTATLEPE